ncbi:MAG: hypothetical protein ABIJ09_03545 [Pseudomonadota bacterium]
MLPPDDDDVEHRDEPLLLNVNALRREGDVSTCLRPLGLCELGSCDMCWYSPEARARLAERRESDNVPGSPSDPKER